jgi:hypothetical protein
MKVLALFNSGSLQYLEKSLLLKRADCKCYWELKYGLESVQAVDVLIEAYLAGAEKDFVIAALETTRLLSWLRENNFSIHENPSKSVTIFYKMVNGDTLYGSAKNVFAALLNFYDDL